MIIAVDFDGTLCAHEYPNIGEEVPLAIRTCRELQKQGHRLILWTMRGNKPDSQTLKEAVDWCAERGLEFWGINENPEQKSTGWSNSNKQYANLYIDDAAFGCPLKYPESGRPYVDWDEVYRKLIVGQLFDEPTFYCRETETVGYRCEEQCDKCKKAENMPNIEPDDAECDANPLNQGENPDNQK